jgi:peptidoglycan/LPS O-acetylase OafA/YrhL
VSLSNNKIQNNHYNNFNLLRLFAALPFIYILLKKDFLKRFISLMLLSFVFYFYITNISEKISIYEKLLQVSILPYLFYFLIGLFVYKFRDKLTGFFDNKVFLFVILYAIIVYLSIDNFIYLLVKQFSFALFVFSFAFSYKELSYKLMKHNDWTYGIYIYHMLVVNIFVQIGFMNEEKYLFGALTLSIICGAVSYFLVEKPFLKQKKKSLFNEINK